MAPIRFDVAGLPKAQPRPKARRCRNFVLIYTPATAKEWKGLVAKAAKPFVRKQPITEPLELHVDFRLPRPQSHLRSNGELKPSAPAFLTTKPDVDNLVKAVMDCLTDAGLWADDKQIVRLFVSKAYTPPDESDGCTVSLSAL